VFHISGKCLREFVSRKAGLGAAIARGLGIPSSGVFKIIGQLRSDALTLVIDVDNVSHRIDKLGIWLGRWRYRRRVQSGRIRTA
jgi:hypothetical protein